MLPREQPPITTDHARFFFVPSRPLQLHASHRHIRNTYKAYIQGPTDALNSNTERESACSLASPGTCPPPYTASNNANTPPLLPPVPPANLLQKIREIVLDWDVVQPRLEMTIKVLVPRTLRQEKHGVSLRRDIAASYASAQGQGEARLSAEALSPSLHPALTASLPPALTASLPPESSVLLSRSRIWPYQRERALFAHARARTSEG